MSSKTHPLWGEKFSLELLRQDTKSYWFETAFVGLEFSGTLAPQAKLTKN